MENDEMSLNFEFGISICELGIRVYHFTLPPRI